MNLTIAKKLALSFGAVIGLMLIAAAVTYFSLERINREIVQLTDRATPMSQSCERLDAGINQSLAALRGFELLGGVEGQDQDFKSERAEAWREIDREVAALKEFAADWHDSKVEDQVKDVSRYLEQLRTVQQKVEDTCHSADNVPAYQLFHDEMSPLLETIVDQTADFVKGEWNLDASAERQETLKKVARMQNRFAQGCTDFQSFLDTGSRTSLDGAEKGWSRYEELAGEIARGTETLPQATKDLWQQLRTSQKRLAVLVKRIAELRLSTDWNKSRSLVRTTALPCVANIQANLESVTEAANRRREQSREQLAAASTTATISMAVGAAVAALLASLIAVLLSRRLVSTIQQLSRRAEAIAAGDLRGESLRIASTDELGQLAECFDKMLVNLQDLTRQVHTVTENVNSAASQVASSSKQQAASTREQASTMQEISSTMREISQTGVQILDKARELSTMSEASGRAGEDGIKAVQDTSRTMESIREQVEDVAENIVALSEKTQTIGDIIATVNEVAEQSNLLALNATIEAVAVGEQGSRFSVVANEMKNLADQAKQCTIQVRNILGEIQKGINSSVMLTEEAVKRVESGKERTLFTEETIRKLFEATEDSSRAFEQIIGATNQQQVGFEQVSKGMEDIREAAQQTAAGTSQLDQAVGSLSAMSRQLKTAVGSYQVL